MLSRLQAHPWHGIPVGADAPVIVNAFIEIVPADTVKYEIDKASGHLKIDRPQRFSNVCPAPYGFVPQTWCRDGVAALAMRQTGRTGIVGDGDPLDICVLTERPINHGSIILRARPIGGLRLFDRREADDKLIGVLIDDPAYGAFRDLADVPTALVDRLRHYFLDVQGHSRRATADVRDRAVYGACAHEVVPSIADYVCKGFPAGDSQCLRAAPSRRGIRTWYAVRQLHGRDQLPGDVGCSSTWKSLVRVAS
jgi:inorganic pyrophosphatase